MNSRERILAAINHQEPDHIALDFGSHRSSGISAIAYGRLKKELEISSGAIYVYDLVQQLAIIEPPVLDWAGSDVIELGRAYMMDDEDWQDWELPDGSPCKIPGYIRFERKGGDQYLLDNSGRRMAVLKAGSRFFEQVHWPLLDRGMEKEVPLDLEALLGQNMWSAAAAPGGHFELNDAGELAAFKEGASVLRSSTDRAILGIFGGNLFETLTILYRMDNALLNMAMYPERVLEVVERITELNLISLDRYLDAIGDSIDIILFGDDLGSNTGPIFAPEMYRLYFKPYHRRMWDRVREKAPHLKIQLHSCGGIEPFLEDLIDAGLDMVNPVQINAAGMDPQMLRDKYQGRITFWGGGCNTQEVLNLGSPSEVREHVRSMMDIWKPGTGYVFQQVHNILPEVPVPNIISLFETFAECR